MLTSSSAAAGSVRLSDELVLDWLCVLAGSGVVREPPRTDPV